MRCPICGGVLVRVHGYAQCVDCSYVESASAGESRRRRT